MKKIIFLSILTLLMIGCTQKSTQFKGTVKLIVGDATISTAKKSSKLKLDDKIKIGDIITTKENTTVIIELNDNFAELEIQSNTVFNLAEYSKKTKELNIKKGNIWIRVNKKLKKGQYFRLRTPTAVASVRGTKFYSYQIGDIQGICICEGKINYGINSKKTTENANKDISILSRNGKSITITSEEIKKFCIDTGSHNHSRISNSQLGQEAKSMTPENQKRLLKHINEKLK